VRRALKSRLCACLATGERCRNEIVHLRHPSCAELSATIEPVYAHAFLAPIGFVVSFDFAVNRMHATALESFAHLSARERDVARLIAEGLSNVEICTRLSKSLPTVKMHVGAIFRKLRVRSRTQVALKLNEKGPSAGFGIPSGQSHAFERESVARSEPIADDVCLDEKYRLAPDDFHSRSGNAEVIAR
jgi:DNA-binding CsgD family transcriptional regulator